MPNTLPEERFTTRQNRAGEFLSLLYFKAPPPCLNKRIPAVWEPRNHALTHTGFPDTPSHINSQTVRDQRPARSTVSQSASQKKSVCQSAIWVISC